MPENLLTVDQAAVRLQLSPTSVRIHLREGKLRGVKRGRAWRIPENALLEPAPRKRRSVGNPVFSITDDSFAAIAARRQAELRALFTAPLAIREAAFKASAEAAEIYYATPEGREELADWRALDGEPFHDDLGDYDSEDSQ